MTIVNSTGSTPRKTGSRMIVKPDGSISGSVGGGSVERISIEKSLELLKTGNSEFLNMSMNDSGKNLTGMICGGSVGVLFEPFGFEPRLFLFGGGHVAEPTAQLANELGFRVKVFDDRVEWANIERFPTAEICNDDIIESAKRLDSSKRDYIILMTPSHSIDYKILTNIIDNEYHYLGVIGSQKKALEIKKELTDDGFSKKQIDRITCPIGIKIGSHTPMEIAISINAQLIQIKNPKKHSIIK